MGSLPHTNPLNSPRPLYHSGAVISLCSQRSSHLTQVIWSQRRWPHNSKTGLRRCYGYQAECSGDRCLNTIFSPGHTLPDVAVDSVILACVSGWVGGWVVLASRRRQGSARPQGAGRPEEAPSTLSSYSECFVPPQRSVNQ